MINLRKEMTYWQHLILVLKLRVDHETSILLFYDDMVIYYET